MLRTYKPISHPIFTLQIWLEHLVCEVWCNASEDKHCYDLLHPKMKGLYDHLDWVKQGLDDVYEKCITLSDFEKSAIKEAFKTNNDIEQLCNGNLRPVELDVLPDVVQKEMKELLKSFYTRLLDITQVPGKKLDYYNALKRANKFNSCPVCGLTNIETADSEYIEDYDHFFPKAPYPFTSVNFKNLIPTCDKCNKKHKKSKKPLAKNGKAYYPFEVDRKPIEVSLNLKIINFDKERQLGESPTFTFSGDREKNETWDWLYNIKKRYSDEIRRFSFNWLRSLKQQKEFYQDKTMVEIIDFNIASFEYDKFDEMKFLKIALLKELKNQPEWMAVYEG